MDTKTLLTAFAGVAIAGSAAAAPIAVDNFSFEADENTNSGGGFASGEAQDFGGELTAWLRVGGAGGGLPAVGWKDIVPTELVPSPPVGTQESQALSLRSGGHVQNTTATAWSSLAAGDELTLTISLGMRAVSALNWTEETFFGLTDGDADLATVEIADTVANSGLIANNPATGDQTGDGTFTDVSFSYTVQASDLARNGNIGILLSSFGSGGGSDPTNPAAAQNQSFFENVRLDLEPVPEPGSLALLGLGGLLAFRRRRA